VITKVRLRAEIDDIMEVEHSEDASDEDIILDAQLDWQFVEASSWTEEIIR
jgi:hypothetical protein